MLRRNANAELIGDVVLFRNDDNAEPVDLTLAEWKDFAEVLPAPSEPPPSLFRESL